MVATSATCVCTFAVGATVRGASHLNTGNIRACASGFGAGVRARFGWKYLIDPLQDHVLPFLGCCVPTQRKTCDGVLRFNEHTPKAI